MAIVKLDKVTLYGIARGRDEVLDGLQSLGCLHLINLHERSVGKIAEPPIHSECHAALKFLDACSVQESPAKYGRDFDCVDVTREVLRIKEQRRELREEQESIQRQVKTLEPWGDFQMPSADDLGNLRLWFYSLRRRQLPVVEAAEVTWQIVVEDNQYAYIVVVSQDKPSGIPGSPLELPDRPLNELRARLVDIDEELEQSQLRRIYLTRWSHFIRQELNKADDELTRQVAQQHMVDEADVCAIQGWVPRVAIDAVRKFASEKGLALTVEQPVADEAPPTLLKNPQQVEGAQGAVTFYITPNYRAWDPTWIVFFSFSLFFAMIMSDAGYGLVLGVILGVFWKKLSASASGRAFRNLLIMLIVSCIAYGVVLGSYFGLDPSAENSVLGGSIFSRLQLRVGEKGLMDDTNRYAMMGIAVLIGVLHIALANLVAAWQNRGSAQALSAVGWVLVLFGGTVAGVGALPEAKPLVEYLSAQWQMSTLAATLTTYGGYTAIGGFVCVFLFSSAKPLFSPKPLDYVWRVLDGLQGLTGISKAFGDVLSYLRLFALGLASAQLASTFNNLAQGMLDIPGLGLLLALLIVLVGHGINLMLGIMGGVVHGLRLNCIEFFNWCLTEEGYPFRAFCKKVGS